MTDYRPFVESSFSSSKSLSSKACDGMPWLKLDLRLVSVYFLRKDHAHNGTSDCLRELWWLHCYGR